MTDSIAQRYKRWRHTRGYGVHSPFAFMLVTEVIRSQYAWYGYSAIHKAVGPRNIGSRAARRARLLLRLCARLRPESIAFTDPDALLLHIAAQEGCPSAQLLDHTHIGSAKLMIASGQFDINSLIQGIRAGNSLLAYGINPEQSRLLTDALPQGVGFVSTDALLLVGRKDTHKVIYTANF